MTVRRVSGYNGVYTYTYKGVEFDAIRRGRCRWASSSGVTACTLVELLRNVQQLIDNGSLMPWQHPKTTTTDQV